MGDQGNEGRDVQTLFFGKGRRSCSSVKISNGAVGRNRRILEVVPDGYPEKRARTEDCERTGGGRPQ